MLSKPRVGWKYFATCVLLYSSVVSFAQLVPRADDPAKVRNLLASPMSFEGFSGEHSTEFFARASGYSVSLSRGEIKLQFATQGRQVTPEIVRISFAGSDEKAQAEPEEALPGVVHYYIGSDPARWRTDVRRYRRVRFRDIYPGTGLVFYGSRQLGDFNELEFDFEVAPGHEVNAIRMVVEGATVREFDGNLELATPSGNVAVLKKPEIFQLRRGKREPISGGYMVREGNEIGFSVPKYDRTLPLIIDPALGYSTLVQHLLEVTLFAGQFPSGAEFLEFDSINGIAADSSGNAYITGEASAPDPSLGFQGTPSLPTSSVRVGDAFVVKLDPTGSNLVYAAYLGGNPSAIVGSSASKIALDSGNNAYIVGTTNSPSFVTTPGAFSRIPVCPVETVSNMNCSETFAAKFDATGHLVFSTYLVTGGSTDTAGPSLGTKRIAVDSSGAVYVAGDIFPALFVFPKDPAPPSVAGLTVTPGAFQTTRKNNRFAYVLKLHADGSTLDYSTYLGGSGNGNVGEAIGGIAVDATGVAYVDGATASADFPTTAGAFQTSNSGTSAFYSKVATDGSALLYSTFLGAPTLTSAATAIALDSSNNAFIGGNTNGPGFPTTPGVFNPNVTGTGTFNFVSEFDTAGNLALSTYIGSADTSGVAAHATGIYVGGRTGSPSYPALNSIEPPPVAGEVPMYVTKLNLAGSVLVYSTFVGTTVNGMTGMAVDPGQNVYLSGGAFDAFPTTVGSFQTNVDVIGNYVPSPFVTKIVPSLGAAVPVVAPRALKFTQVLQQGVASNPLTVRLSNFGDADLSLVSIAISGTNPVDFSQTNNCPAILPGGKNCTVTVVFTPTVPSGARSANLVFTFGGGFAAQSVSLSGTAGSPIFQITPVPGDFGTFGQLENSIKTFTITNAGTGPMSIANAALTPPGNFPSTDFSFGPPNASPAPVVLQPGQSTQFSIWMHIGLDFGNLAAQFRVDDNTSSSPHIFQLTGFGFKTTPDFGMSTPNGVPATATVTAGQTATYNVIVATLPGFGIGGGSIAMSCTGAPTSAVCNLDRTSLPLPDNNPETVVVSVSTSSASASLRHNVAPWWWAAAAFGIVLMLPGKKSRASILAGALLLIALGTFVSCSSGGSGSGSRGGNVGPPTPPGTYTLTVTATSGSVSHSFPLTLVVK
jgi:beta-propeller repeat-containing protein